MEKDGYTYIYLVSYRKSWQHDLPDSWQQVSFKRGSFIECGTFRKRTEDLTQTDKENWVDAYGIIPEEWID